MSRISLVEAYDNRDVIGQLVKLRQDVKQLYDIVENIDPSGDLTNFVTKTGDETIDGIKTFVGKIVADCDIIQLGNGYETHAEQVYSKDDYIIMRDGAIAGLAAADRSGLEIVKYNGTDNARLAVDRNGVARVGDVGDEQPLLTRDETADMTSGNILSWDGVDQKAITSGKSVSEITGDISSLQGDVAALESAVPGKVSGTGNIGSDTVPVKIVNGTATAVSRPLADYTPLTVSVESTGFGDVIQCVGRITYQRTAYKKGLLSGTIKITANSDTSFRITSIGKISSLIGISFASPSGDIRTGQWISDKSTMNGMGTYVTLTTAGLFQIGRVYTASGAYGSWSLADASDAFIMFQNVELNEA